MIKRFLVLAVLASTFAAPTFGTAEAGPLRDKLRQAASRAKDVVKVGALATRCTLKGKPGQVIC